MESDEFLEKNRKQRLEFVKFWAEYVKKSPNAVWSKQQSDFINSVLRNSKVDPKVYMKIKQRI